MVNKAKNRARAESVRYLSAAGLASRWGLSLTATYRTISEELPHLRISHAIRVPLDAVEDYEQRMTVVKAVGA
jgi:hypothetical protein